jgi:biotin transport system substrate-specific component
MSGGPQLATLIEVLQPHGTHARWLTMAGAIMLAVCLLTVSAKIQVPFWPVPMTLQTLVVLMLGMSYGPRLAVVAIAAYLAVGAAGLPVFAGTPARGTGIPYMMGPTGGFLVGFLLAAGLVGHFAERGWDRSFPACAAAMLIGHAVIVLSGVAWLVVLMGLRKAIDVGLVPFFVGSAVKTALGAALMPLLWWAFARI